MADNPGFSMDDEKRVNGDVCIGKDLCVPHNPGVRDNGMLRLSISSLSGSYDQDSTYSARSPSSVSTENIYCEVKNQTSGQSGSGSLGQQNGHSVSKDGPSVHRHNSDLSEGNDDGPITFVASKSGQNNEKKFLNVPGLPSLKVSPETSESVEDGCMVVSLPVPILPRAHSAPDLSTTNVGESPVSPLKKCNKETQPPDKKGRWKQMMEMSKEEMLRTYRLHIFVLLIFLVIVISISMSWYYKTMAKELLLAKQAIIFDPRARKLELNDHSKTYKVHVHLGKEIPDWILPLHCPEFEKNNLNVKKCVWKNKAVLTVRNFGNEQVNCYNVSWESLQHQYFPHDCLSLGSSVWYGPSNQSSSIFPIKGAFQFQHSDFTIQNNGIFGSRLDYYWLSSAGASFYVHPDMPVQLFWNMSGAHDLCVVSNFTEPMYHHKQSLPYLNYTVCLSHDVLETHAFMQHNIFSSSQFLNVSAQRIFQSPFWSVKNFSTPGNITQENVATLISEGEANGFVMDKISLDVAWEQTTGDLTFDPLRFNMTFLEELSVENKRQIVLTVTPYFKFSSKHFELGVKNSTFVKDAGGKVPGLILYNGELVAVLDIFNGVGLSWYADQIQGLKNLHINDFRLTYGNQSWLPYKPQFQLKTATPNMYRRLMTEAISRLSENLIVEHSSDSRHIASYVPVTATIDSVNGRNCIVDVVEESLTLSLMGYPLIMMDGYRERNGAKMTSELYKRWLQLALTFPAYQISIPPWRLEKSLVDTANQLQQDRNATFNDLPVKLARSMFDGHPLLRPIWWPDSGNDTAHRMEIKDEFLLGDEFLVAPILCEGDLQRDIYIPSGIWELDNTITLGPKVLYNYTIGLDRLLVFKHRKQQ